jgi:hypothetical protein
VPVAPQQFAHRGAAANMHKLGFVGGRPDFVTGPLVATPRLHHVHDVLLSRAFCIERRLLFSGNYRVIVVKVNYCVEGVNLLI